MPQTPTDAVAEPSEALALSTASLALTLEAQGNTAAALELCQRALAIAPRSAGVAGEMGRLALRQGRLELAEPALAAHLEAAPSADAAIDLAHAQRGLHAFDRAQATLTAALQGDAGAPSLWLALAQLLCVQGRHGQAVVFFEEALRLAPTAAMAQDGLAEALMLGGDPERALAASEAALAAAASQDAPRLRAAHARRLLAAGRFEDGWAAFADDTGQVEVRAAAPRWTPGAPAEGQVLWFGEPDAADEILLAQAIPDLLARGPPPILAVPPPWFDLARRSFPGAHVVRRLTRLEDGRTLQAAEVDTPHRHGGQIVGAWAPLRAALPGLRGDAAAFGAAAPYLTPDPQRVAYWRAELAAMAPGPRIGLLCRAPGADQDRAWAAPHLASLAAALRRPDLRVIGIQAEQVLGELAWVRQTFGLPIGDPPPGFQPENLDDVAALSLALDAVVGVPTAASYVAAASGAETWFLAPPRHWALLGGDTFPWFPTARVFSAAAPDDWRDALSGLERALRDLPAAN